MRGALIIGMAVVLLIIALLVMKNMGVDNRGVATETKVKKQTEQVKSASDEANEKIKDILGQVSGAE